MNDSTADRARKASRSGAVYLLPLAFAVSCGSLESAIALETRPAKTASSHGEENLEAFFEGRFNAYPATSTDYGVKARLKWRSDAKARRYRTSLIRAWKKAKEPNFSGHYYAVSDIGCGTGCRVIFIVDWRTGEIFYPPEDHSFSVRKESRLMILKPYSVCTPYGPPLLYAFEDGVFKEIKHDKCS